MDGACNKHEVRDSQCKDPASVLEKQAVQWGWQVRSVSPEHTLLSNQACGTDLVEFPPSGWARTNGEQEEGYWKVREFHSKSTLLSEQWLFAYDSGGS